MPDTNDGDLKPICFVVMPFRRKKVDDPKGANAPAELDCDALYDRAYQPAITELGYLPVRADYDPGSVIVKDMLERLALADLVLADVSLPNGNVYYEIGLRHVAKETSCVMLAATWSRQLFDIDQFTTIRYPLTDGDVPDDQARVIRSLIVEKVPVLKDAKTPYHEFIHGGLDELGAKGVFRDFVERLSEFQASVRAIRLKTDGDRTAAVIGLTNRFAGATLGIPEVAIELLSLVRDYVGWAETKAFIESLPGATRTLPLVQEQYLLALANTGQPLDAIARLEELIRLHGDSPERQGLIGGRYKRLWRDARKAREAEQNAKPSLVEAGHLDRAIEHYERGMQLDLNEYYCSSNIPSLLRARAEEGDADRAAVVDRFVIDQCERAIARDTGDEWVRPTLLGAAFRAGDTAKARDLAKRIAREDVVTWKLAATLPDLAESLRQTSDPATRATLQSIHDQLEALNAGGGG